MGKPMVYKPVLPFAAGEPQIIGYTRRACAATTRGTNFCVVQASHAILRRGTFLRQ